MLDPLLHMGVEVIRNVLSRGPRFDVLVLHLFDDLNGVFGDGVEWSHHASILNRPGRTDEGQKVLVSNQ